jgi:hypothetical protein
MGADPGTVRWSDAEAAVKRLRAGRTARQHDQDEAQCGESRQETDRDAHAAGDFAEAGEAGDERMSR